MIQGNGLSEFCWIFLSGCSHATASVSSDPNTSEQLAERHRCGGGKLINKRKKIFPLPYKHISSFFLTSQASCAVFEKSLKTLGGDFAPLVPQLCELISQLFSNYPQACALDLIQQVERECVFPQLERSSTRRYSNSSLSLCSFLAASRICL